MKTVSFRLRGSRQIWHLLLLLLLQLQQFYSKYLLSITIVFSSWIIILSSQWLLEIWTKLTWPHFQGVSSWRCFARTSLQPFVFSYWKAAPLVWNQWTNLKKIHFLWLKKPWVAFAVCLLSLSICTLKYRSAVLWVVVWMWVDGKALYTWEFILLLLPVVTSSVNSSEAIRLVAIHSHVITLPLPHLTHNVGWFGSCALPIILTQVSLAFICLKILLSRGHYW